MRATDDAWDEHDRIYDAVHKPLPHASLGTDHGADHVAAMGTDEMDVLVASVLTSSGLPLWEIESAVHRLLPFGGGMGNVLALACLAALGRLVAAGRGRRRDWDGQVEWLAP